MARNLIKYQNIEQFSNEQENVDVVTSVVPGVAYVKEGKETPTGFPAPDGSESLYNEAPMPPIPPEMPYIEPYS
jgi:hypothetical protein